MKQNDLEYATIYYIHKTEFFIKDLEKLLPTKSAAEHHSLGVHYEILQWKNVDQNDFSPTHWGWKNCNESFEQIDTILEPGTAKLVNVVKCNCKHSKKTPCGANNCSFSKNSLPCVTACKNCHGNSCTNVPKFEILDDPEDGSF